MSAFVIALLVALNALYVAAEFSAVAAQRGRVADLAARGNRRAGALLALLQDGARLDRYIAACQIGITVTSLVAGAYGQTAVAPKLWGPLSRGFDLSTEAAASVAAVVVLLGLTTLQVVLGELVPKSLALQFPERTALATYVPTAWSARVFRAFIWFLNGSAFLLLRPFGVRPGGHEHVHSPEEIALMVDESQKGGALSPEMSSRLQRALRLPELTVRDLMVPRDEIAAIDASASSDAILESILGSPYSRMPVYRGTLDRVIGAVGTKDLVASFARDGVIPPLSDLLRPLPRVRDTLRADQFVRFLEEHKSSKALVVDAHDRVQGFVSIEDALGQLFGEIRDELKATVPPPAAERG